DSVMQGEAIRYYLSGATRLGSVGAQVVASGVSPRRQLARALVRRRRVVQHNEFDPAVLALGLDAAVYLKGRGSFWSAGARGQQGCAADGRHAQGGPHVVEARDVPSRSCGADYAARNRKMVGFLFRSGGGKVFQCSIVWVRIHSSPVVSERATH